MADITTLLTKDISPHTVVAHLQKELPETAEIYAVIKTKDGNFHELISGDAGGACFAALILQEKARETI